MATTTTTTSSSCTTRSSSSSLTEQQQRNYSRYIGMSRHRPPASSSSTSPCAAAVCGGTKPKQQQGGQRQGEWEWVISLASTGEANVGKSTFMSRCIQGRTSGPLPETTSFQCDGEGFYHGTFDLAEKGKHTVLQTKMWDSAGEERFRHVCVSWHRKCVGFFVIFDLSDHESFAVVPLWVTEITRYTGAETGDLLPKVFIVGNKCDLARAVAPEEIQSLCSELGGVPYFEVSCNTGQGLLECWNAALASTYRDLLIVAEAHDSQHREEKRRRSKVKKKKTGSTDGCSLS
ncbi:Ras family [Pelomyxa schiedti]|nr:Ras family [Pelomyxa schiedti]